MNDDLRRQAASPDWATRQQAVTLLRQQGDEDARRLLATMLKDDDLAVIGAAVEALLTLGEPGWVAALEGVWNTELPGEHEQFRSAFLDLILAGVDVESALQNHVDDPRTPQSTRGALEMLMDLGLRPTAYITDENGE